MATPRFPWIALWLVIPLAACTMSREAPPSTPETAGTQPTATGTLQPGPSLQQTQVAIEVATAQEALRVIAAETSAVVRATITAAAELTAAVPAPTATPPPATPEAERIRFAPGQVQVSEEVGVGQRRRFVLYAFAGQIMRVYVYPQPESLHIYGEDGTELTLENPVREFWRGELPASQDYIIDTQNHRYGYASIDRPLQVSILIVPRGQQTQWLDYREEAAGFELSYPDYFAISDTPAGFREPAALTLQFTATEYFRDNNLSTASLSVSRTEDLEPCTHEPYPGTTFVDQIELGGTNYRRIGFMEGGAGNIWESVSHLTIHGDICFVIMFFFHSHHADAYSPPVAEFDREGIETRMRGVLSTLRFLDD